MKYNIFKSLLAVTTGGLLLAASGCKKLEDFGDTNINPLGVTSPITAALLTNAQFAIGGQSLIIRPALYVQYIAETQYTDASIYAEPKLDFGGTYSGPLQDLQVIINKNTDPATAGAASVSGSNANQIAVAKIMKTYFIWTTTDRWGDIPYKEALQGASNFTPTFDMQSEIYKAMIADLKSAVDGFDGGQEVKGDVMYGGNIAKWKKLGNTLRMLISLRTSKVYPNAGQLAATEFSAAISHPAGIIETNADNFTLPYPGGPAYQHPWFATYDGRSDYALSKTIADILANMNDARRSAFGSPGTPFPYGLKREQATTLPTNYALVLSDANRAVNSPVVVVSAAVSLLAKAEAIERGWIASSTYGSAQAAYEAAITASFAQWNVAGAAAYIAGSAANYNTGTGGGSNIGANSFNSVVGADAITTTKLQRIALQRYLALFPDGTQAWSEWRRTGVPNLKPTAYATNEAAGKQIPRRYVYGTAEYSLNPAKVAEAAGRITGGDVMNGRVWWDL